MADEAPLVAISSKKHHKVEKKIVLATVKTVRAWAKAADVDDIRTIALEGMDEHPEASFSTSVRAVIVANIRHQVGEFGVVIVHVNRDSCDFQFHDIRKRP